MGRLPARKALMHEAASWPRLTFIMTPTMPMTMPRMLERSTGGISSSAADVDELPSAFHGAVGTYFFAASGSRGSPPKACTSFAPLKAPPLPLPPLLRLMAPQTASQLAIES